MNNTEECGHCDHLAATIEAAHERALRALSDNRAPLDAVVWLSAHLAAMDRVVYPAVRRHVAGADSAVREQERLSSELQHTLRTLEQVLSGDATARRLGHAALIDHLVTLLSTHAAEEHQLLDALGRAVGADEADRLMARYERAVTVGPTRPHPHTPHEGLAVRTQFILNKWRDHVLDVLDARHVPIPKQRRSVPRPGRWGQYLLGMGTLSQTPKPKE